MHRPIAALVVIFLVCVFSYAEPIQYRMEFTRVSGIGSVKPVDFTFDPSTELFTGLAFDWMATTRTHTFRFLGCGPVCVIDGYPSPPRGVNDWSSDAKKMFLNNLLDGGAWSAIDPVGPSDVYFTLEGVSVVLLGLGANSGDASTGTFSAQQIPEPASIAPLTLGLGALLFSYVRRHRRNR